MTEKKGHPQFNPLIQIETKELPVFTGSSDFALTDSRIELAASGLELSARGMELTAIRITLSESEIELTVIELTVTVSERLAPCCSLRLR